MRNPIRYSHHNIFVPIPPRKQTEKMFGLATRTGEHVKIVISIFFHTCHSSRTKIFGLSPVVCKTPGEGNMLGRSTLWSYQPQDWLESTGSKKLCPNVFSKIPQCGKFKAKVNLMPKYKKKNIRKNTINPSVPSWTKCPLKSVITC